MKRTQIYIDPETYARARAVAKSSGQTVSELIRTSLARFLPKTTKGENSLVKLEELSHKYTPKAHIPTDLSTNLDHYLYGVPKKKT